MATIFWPAKDPDEVLDYSIDWSARMEDGDAIDTIAWTVPAGLTQGAVAVAGNVSSVFLSGGVDGTSYDVGCRCTTTGGRVMDETARIKIKTR